MASILRRTMFADTRNGQVRFLDFNLVNLSTGGWGVEPRQLDELPVNAAERSYENELTKVDKIDFGADCREFTNMFNDLHGGWQIPRKQGYTDV